MEDTVDSQTQQGSSPKSPIKKPIRATVTPEVSIEVILDILADMEEDELLVQTQPEVETFQPTPQVQPSYFNHRFAIYRKRPPPTSQMLPHK